MRKKKGFKSKEKIVSEAIRAFARDGFASAKLQDIARKVGVQHTAILHHFGDKLSLFKACLEEVIRHFGQIMEARLDPKDDARQRLDKAFEANVEWVRNFPDEVSMLISMYPLATYEKTIRELYAEVLRSSRRRYETLVRSAIREGLFSEMSDPELVAELFHEFVMGAMVNLLSGSHSVAQQLPRVRAKWKLLLDSRTR